MSISVCVAHLRKKKLFTETVYLFQNVEQTVTVVRIMELANVTQTNADQDITSIQTHKYAKVNINILLIPMCAEYQCVQNTNVCSICVCIWLYNKTMSK